MNPKIRMAWFTLSRLAARPMEAFALLFLSLTSVTSSALLPKSLEESAVVCVLIATGIPLIGYLAITETSRFFADYHLFEMELERGVSQQVGKIQFATQCIFFGAIFALQVLVAIAFGRTGLQTATETFALLLLALIFALRLSMIATRTRIRESVDTTFSLVAIPLVVLAFYAAYIGLGTMIVVMITAVLQTGLVIAIGYGILSCAAIFLLEWFVNVKPPRSVDHVARDNTQ